MEPLPLNSVTLIVCNPGKERSETHPVPKDQCGLILVRSGHILLMKQQWEVQSGTQETAVTKSGACARHFKLFL